MLFKVGQNNSIHIKYVYVPNNKDPLYEKALDELSLINNFQNIDHTQANYLENVLLQYELDLKKNSLMDFAKFQTYKIVHFLEAYHGIKVLKIRTEFLKDEYHNLWLVNSSYLNIIELSKIKKHDWIIKKINLVGNEEKTQLDLHLEEESKTLVEKRKTHVKEIGNHMKNKYEAIKTKLGIDLNAKPIEDHFSDQVNFYMVYIKFVHICLKVFRNLNPNTPYVLSELISSNVISGALKAHLLGNFPNEKERLLEKERIKRPKSSLPTQKVNSSYSLAKTY